MAEFHVVIEPVFNRRPGRELCVWPDAQDCGRQDMGARMAYALQLGHFIPVVERFALGLLLIVLIRLHKVFFQSLALFTSPAG